MNKYDESTPMNKYDSKYDEYDSKYVNKYDSKYDSNYDESTPMNKYENKYDESTPMNEYDSDENKPVWPAWAVGILSGVRDVETHNRGRPS
jgi:hypothetical protein